MASQVRTGMPLLVASGATFSEAGGRPRGGTLRALGPSSGWDGGGGRTARLRSSGSFVDSGRGLISWRRTARRSPEFTLPRRVREFLPIALGEREAHGTRVTRWLAGVLAMMQSGCLIGYDSRWGQQKQAQQHYAEAQTPQKLKAERRGDADAARGRLRTMRVRLRATSTYAAQVVDWQRRFDDQLGIVNGVL